MKTTMDLFTQLRHHAQTRSGTIATASPHRITTYRKLWSRIERATARLQREWQVGRGDSVVYLGRGHPDAIVLYVALARSGAFLVPLEEPSLQQDIHRIIRELNVSLILHDGSRFAPHDTLSAATASTPVTAPAIPTRPLSDLIERPCEFEPLGVVEDTHLPSLIRSEYAKDNQRHLRSHSLAELQAGRHDVGDGPCVVRGGLFGTRIFAPLVLPALMSGGTLILHPAVLDEAPVASDFNTATRAGLR